MPKRSARRKLGTLGSSGVAVNASNGTSFFSSPGASGTGAPSARGAGAPDEGGEAALGGASSGATVGGGAVGGAGGSAAVALVGTSGSVCAAANVGPMTNPTTIAAEAVERRTRFDMTASVEERQSPVQRDQAAVGHVSRPSRARFNRSRLLATDEAPDLAHDG